MEKGYFTRIISGNINQRIEIDSMQCDFDNYPYRVKTFAKQYISRQSNITERTLITDCQLTNSVRSDNNPQGLMLERFVVLQNRDINTIIR